MQDDQKKLIMNGQIVSHSEIKRRLNNCYSEYHDMFIFLHEYVSENEPGTLEEHRAMRNILKDRVNLMVKRLSSYINPPDEFRK